jgi:hypothetical protein
MRFLPIVLVIVVCLLPQVQCSKSPTTPKFGLIAVFVHAEGNLPVGGITVDLLQTNESKMTDSTGIAAFTVNPGTYTIRVKGLQGPGPALLTVDSTMQIKAGQVDTLKCFDCLMCV